MNIDCDALRKPCICGKVHPLSVKKIWISSGALQHLPTLLQAWKQPVILCDENTEAAAGENISRLLNQSCRKICLPAANLHADEHGVALAREQLRAQDDVLLAVGSGTIHDITRYLAHERHLPFLSIPTAASVDGFVSTVAAMTWGGFKKTFPAVSPCYVLADTDIFSKAPQRLTASGVADLLGKYTALTDWKLSHLLTGEDICPHICQMEMEALHALSNCLDGLVTGDKAAYETLMYGLLLSGLAMQMQGTSRPASGAEHHLSHLWEMAALNPPISAYHGEKVGVGLLLVTDFYHRAAAKLYAGTAATLPYPGIETSQLRRRIPQPLIQQILQENTPDPMELLPDETLHEKQAEMAAILDSVPSVAELSATLQKVGGVRTMREIGLDSSIRSESLRLSPYVRRRLTGMRILKRFAFYEDLLQ